MREPRFLVVEARYDGIAGNEYALGDMAVMDARVRGRLSEMRVGDWEWLSDSVVVCIDEGSRGDDE